MTDVASNPEMRLNRRSAASLRPVTAEAPASEVTPTRVRKRHPSQPAAFAAVAIFWLLQFLYFSLDKFLEGNAVLWSTIDVRAVVSAFGALISVHILKILQRNNRGSFLRLALFALTLACAGAVIHSLINWALFFALNGPIGGGKFSLATEAAGFPSLFYLFLQVYLAITVILLSISYGEEILRRDRRIAELTHVASAAAHINDDPHIWLRDGTSRFRLEVSDIDWVSAEGECVRFHCGERTFLERLSIAAAAEKLNEHGIVRVHRSTLVNSRHVEGLTRTDWGALQVRLTGGAELRVSKSFEPTVRKLATRLKP